MIDTHCHIQTEQYDADREAMIANSESAGVSHFIVPAIDRESFKATLEVSALQENIYCGLGIHPHSAAEWNTEVREFIQTEVGINPKVVAIGEIGLDYFYDFCPKEQQIKAFREQIELAIESEKPIIIHTRDSIDETLVIVDEYYSDRLRTTGFGQFHCFSGNLEQMRRAVSLGFCVSFTGNITFKNSVLEDVVRETPNDSILIETDSPYLTPVPFRGKRNSPEHLGLIAKKIANIKKLDIQEVMSLTTQNAKRLFLSPFVAAMIFLTLFATSEKSNAQPGSKPPDSVLTKDRRETEELIKKQRDELQRAQEERRQDSIRAAQKEQQDLMHEAMDQSRKDSLRAVERMQDEERAILKSKTPIVWKAIGFGGGIGIGNLSELNQLSRVALTPTSVFASSWSLGTQITRGIDFEFSYNSFTVSDSLVRDRLFRAKTENASPIFLDTNNAPRSYDVPTYESLRTKYLSFDFRFVINPRSPVKFYLGLGYMLVTITSTQTYHEADSLSIHTGKVNPNQIFEASFSRGGIKAVFGARYDLEIGNNLILSPFAQIGAGFLFSGDRQRGEFDFQTPGDPITFTHLNVGASLYFGWFGVQRYR